MVTRTLIGLYHPGGPRGHTYCRRGHPMVGINVFVTRDGRRRCRTCWDAACNRNRAVMCRLHHSEEPMTNEDTETYLARLREIEDLPHYMREQALAELEKLKSSFRAADDRWTHILRVRKAPNGP